MYKWSKTLAGIVTKGVLKLKWPLPKNQIIYCVALDYNLLYCFNKWRPLVTIVSLVWQFDISFCRVKFFLSLTLSLSLFSRILTKTSVFCLSGSRNPTVFHSRRRFLYGPPPSPFLSNMDGLFIYVWVSTCLLWGSLLFLSLLSRPILSEIYF